MAITTFAAIDVGSNELSMKIFEVSKKYGINEIDHIRHNIELGSDTYTNGKINHTLVDELCEVLIGFTKKMQEYQVNDYTACATSAIREAANNILILDQIKLRSGLKIKILSNSEQRFLCYKAIALKETAFNKMIQKGTIIVDVGAGSIQLSLFDKESLVSTQNIKLGFLRIREILSTLENQTSDFKDLLSEYIDYNIQTYKELFLSNNKIKNIIAVGDQLSELTHYIYFTQNGDSITKDNFAKLYKGLFSTTINKLSEELSLSKEQSSLILPTAMIYQKIFEETGADSIWLSGITMCDGIVAEYAEKKEKIIPTHNFTEDIIIAARNIANRYHSNASHIKNVEYIAMSVFDNIRKIHGLGKRERLLLQIAVILHTCGEYVNMNEAAENSYKIVMSTEIIGLSHLEREITANLIRYHADCFPEYSGMIGGFDKDTYIKIAKLTAILRIANAMDKSHKQKFSNLTMAVRMNGFIITADTIEDITLEKGLFDSKADFFEDVYGIRPILKQKRSIS
jgi:exopolyphosphatase/guanosine-5'-triphosphate,3'-diphosphate pyrophosphatase